MIYEFEDLDYDTGLGIENGVLQIEVDPIEEDCSFDAYGPSGKPQSYGGYEVTGFKVLNAAISLYGNNGVELGEVELEEDQVLELWPNLYEQILNKLQGE